MTLLGLITLFGWIPAILLLFAYLPPRRAVAAAFVMAWLFLPVYSFPIVGLPDYSKMSATCAGVLLASVLYHARLYGMLRPHWLDLPMLVWCLVPLATSLSNELGVWDGVSGVLRQTIVWGAPYLIGRIYFRDLPSLSDLARAVFLGGLIYVPLCLFEIRMSPHLHEWLYGFPPHTWDSSVLRLGGWRPIVFMQSGLAVGMWMTSASIVSVVLWRSGTMRRLLGLPSGLLAASVVGTAILCKSTGALVLLACGLVVRSVRGRALVAGVIILGLVPTTYVSLRTTGLWSGADMLALAGEIQEERADSLQTRLKNEDLLVGHALMRPLWGWGGWGRIFVFNPETGHSTGIPDGLWVVAIAANGLVGLVALLALQAFPTLSFLRAFPARTWHCASVAPAAALAIVLLVSAMDNLMNAMYNPIFMLIAGGLTSASVAHATFASSSLRTHPLQPLQTAKHSVLGGWP